MSWGAREWTYRIRFEAEELWGQDKGGSDAVMLDVFESYLIATTPAVAGSVEEAP